MRYRVASYLAHADTPAAEALPVLIEAVKDNEVTDHSCIAISALGGYGPAAGAAVPILSDPGVMERHEYFRAPNPCSPSAALERIGTREAMAALGAQRNRELKWKWSVQEMRLLAKARGDQNPDARESAMRELRSIALKSPKHKRKNIFAALQLLLRYTDKTGRHSAALRSISISFTAAGAVLEEDSPYASPGYLHPASFGTVRAAETQAFDKLTNGKGSTYFRLREYTAELEQIGAPEAMAAPALLQNNELLASALAAPFAFLVFIPALAPLTLLFFAWLFLWSRARHKEGRKFIYRPLLIPVLGWIYISYVVMFELNKHGSFRQINGAYICFWLSVLTTLTGLLPWCASWCLLRLRGRRRSAGA
ncbi:MAG: hypothetical protein A3J79_08625 [Elusimicrobia bacterium RIFOXYB2_FULL_62_6]|nr:MAG: hypothetical protein A3J79_08625 [Elusimicrobia bacterium RIFOXYB2_FULL_62_6]